MEQREGLTVGKKNPEERWTQHPGRAFSLGTKKCVQISTYVLVQHLSCAVLCSPWTTPGKMWLLLLPSCLIALRNNGKQARLRAFEHRDESKQEEVEKSNRRMAFSLTASQVGYPFFYWSINGCWHLWNAFSTKNREGCKKILPAIIRHMVCLLLFFFFLHLVHCKRASCAHGFTTFFNSDSRSRMTATLCSLKKTYQKAMMVPHCIFLPP